MRAIPYGSPEYCAAIAQEADYEKRKAEGYERGLRDENAHLRAQLAEATQQHCQRVAELKGKIESAQSDCARFITELEVKELQLAEANRKVRELREALDDAGKALVMCEN